MLATVLIVVLIVLLLGAFPAGHNAGWQTYGYFPSGLLGVVLLVVLILLLLGRL
jgi:L-asparagine transporter-like permease